MPCCSHIPRLAGLALLAAAVAAPLQGQSDTVTSRQNAFSIPFRVGRAEQESQRPLEVQLYLSDNRGASWRLHSRASPEQGRFNFRAEKDGEYWFYVRTKDPNGRLLPDAAAAPELRVIVDTVQPTLEVTAERGSAGEVIARWKTEDPNLQAHSLRLEYQAQRSTAPWQSVAIDHSRGRYTPTGYTGEVTWWPQSTTQPLTVRAEVVDTSGNRTVTQAEVASPRPALTSSRPAAQLSPAAPDRPALASSTQPFSTQPSSTQPSSTQWPAERATSALTGQSGDAHWGAPLIQRLPSAIVPSAPGNSTIAPHVPPNSAPGGTPETNSWIRPPLREIPRADARQPQSALAPGQPLVAYRLPAGVRPKMVNSRTFQLDYDVESLGPWGIRKVELWGTRDGGQTWISFGVDTDNRSPIAATVADEGIYGFRVLVQGGNGLAETPPHSGESPEMWVGVDLTPPTCRLIGVHQGEADHSSELVIDWESNDARPAERPISLAYSEQPGGNWTTIASGLPNTGQYTWHLDSRVPDRLFLRLEVRDEAGNLASHQTAEALLLAHLRPKGRIREVRPSATTTQGPQVYRFW